MKTHSSQYYNNLCKSEQICSTIKHIGYISEATNAICGPTLEFIVASRRHLFKQSI